MTPRVHRTSSASPNGGTCQCSPRSVPRAWDVGEVHLRHSRIQTILGKLIGAEHRAKNQR
jgi:hypothetical protein